MDDDIFRILVSTDNHLGFQERSAVRHDDSFASFEEVLQTAHSQQADFVLLGGDLFHENKPSRRTVYNTLNLLRKYCTGNDAIYMEILSKQEEIFTSNAKKINYEDPHQSISMPVFAIHGNHDDPSRDGVGQPLSALDFFSASNLINYIGKHDHVEEIEIAPILMRKGKTTIALYPLGAIRDERLNRMWTNKKVKFLKPSSDLGLGNVINIFVLHQNRDYGRGRKNCVHETMIPEWMDVVIWGNEHECVPSMVESLAGTFRIYQPGSSVATSLSEGESSRYPKQIGILEIFHEKFRLRTLPYKHIRPFVYADLALASIESLNTRSSGDKLEVAVEEILANRVKQLIREARDLITDDLEHPEETKSFRVREPQKVIVRLRVDYTGFPIGCINLQRFGTKFVDDVANPSDMVLFAKKKAEGQKNTGASGHSTAFQSEFTAWMEGDKEAVNRIKVEDLVCDALVNQQKQLGLLAPEHLSLALEDFVMRKIPSAINDVVESSLETTQKLLCKDATALSKDDIQAAAMRAKEKAKVNVNRNASQETSSKPASSSERKRVTAKKANQSKVSEDFSDEEIDSSVKKTNKGKKRAHSSASPVESRQKTSAATSRQSRTITRTRNKKNISYADPDDEDVISINSEEGSDACDDLSDAYKKSDDELLDSSDEEFAPKKSRKMTTRRTAPASKAKTTTRGAKKAGSASSASKKTSGKPSSSNAYNDSDDESLEEISTPASTRNKKNTTTSRQQKLNFTAGSTTSSSRSRGKKKDTSSALDMW